MIKQQDGINMNEMFLLKLGEIVLKGQNRYAF